MPLTKKQVVQLRAKLQGMFDEFEQLFGWRIKLGNCTYLDVANFKLTASLLQPDGSAISKEEADFKRYAAKYGLEGQLGKTFAYQGKHYKITGAKPGNRKSPILAQRTDGRMFKFPAEAVRRFLGLTPLPGIDVSA